MDDHARYFIHHELCSNMATPNVERNVEAALKKTGLPQGMRPKSFLTMAHATYLKTSRSL